MANNLEIFRGDTKQYTLNFKDAVGVAIDITDWTVFFTVKKERSDLDAAAKISKTVVLHTNAAEGTTRVNITAAEAATLEPGQYYYDIQVKKSDGSILTIISDMLVIKEDITRRTV